MADQMTDERALQLLRDAVADSRYEYDKTVRGYAIAHIASRLQAQQPGAEAVAWMCEKQHVGYTSTQVALDKESAAAEIADGATVIPLYTAPPPPALPEVTDEDVQVAAFTADQIGPQRNWVRKRMRAALESYRARLMAKAVQS